MKLDPLDVMMGLTILGCVLALVLLFTFAAMVVS